MPDRRSQRGVAWPSEASFVLRQQTDTLLLPPHSRRTGQSATTPEADRPSPLASPESGRSRALQPATLTTSIGVISDNHGYLDPAVLELFAGVTHIIHAGDIVDPGILTALGQVAPVTAVAGNADTGELAAGLPREVAGQVAGVRFVLGHKRKRLLKSLVAGTIEGDLEGAAPHLVVFGHEHVPTAAWVEGTLFLNPGSASAPNEEDDWPTVAIVSVRPTGLAVCFIPLERRREEAARARPGRP